MPRALSRVVVATVVPNSCIGRAVKQRAYEHHGRWVTALNVVIELGGRHVLDVNVFGHPSHEIEARWEQKVIG